MGHEGGPSIQAIKRGDVHRITSGQVILDIQTAVKELIENALDAGATTIEVRFKEYGADAIEVLDNGSGIEVANYESLALKHHTSKLDSFQDLVKVQTFGFRGEALSSLCELSRVQVITATQAQEPVGTVLDFGRDGSIEKKDKRVARQRGTTVIVSDLFHSLPVRRRELLKNVKREFAKAQTLLQAYAVISRGVRWVVSNSVKGRRTPVMTIAGAANDNFLSSNVAAVFGAKASISLVTLKLAIPLGSGGLANDFSAAGQGPVDSMPASDEAMDVDAETDSNAFVGVHVSGLISRPAIASGRASSDRCFLYVNGRPWDSPKVVRAFNEVYRTFNVQQYPMVVANFEISGNDYDVNVSPDKRTLFLHREADILDGLKTQLEEAFKPFQSVFKVHEHSKESQSVLPFRLQETAPRPDQQEEGDDERSRASNFTASSQIEVEQEERPKKQAKLRNDIDDEEDEEIEEVQTKRQPTFSIPALPRPRTIPSFSATSVTSPPQSNRIGRNASSATIDAKLRESGRPIGQTKVDISSFAAPGSQKDRTLLNNNPIAKTEETSIDTPDVEDESADSSVISATSPQATPPEDHEVSPLPNEESLPTALSDIESDEEAGDAAERAHNINMLDQTQCTHVERYWRDEFLGQFAEEDGTGGAELEFDLAKIVESIKARGYNESALSGKINSPRSEGNQPSQTVEEAAVGQADAAAAEAILSRFIDKSDFANMEVIGQFNLGFILVRRIKEIAEGPLEDDVFIIDQHAADEKYNFETLSAQTKLQSQRLIAPRTLQLSPADETVVGEHQETLATHGFEVKIDENALPGSRISLVALPMSQHVALGVDDLEELLHRLGEERPGSERARLMRCSKLRALYASRACRRSVMVGMALNHRQMDTVVRHLGHLDQPWNCPHGRPTMRHLFTMAKHSQQSRHLAADRSEVKWDSLLSS